MDAAARCAAFRFYGGAAIAAPLGALHQQGLSAVRPQVQPCHQVSAESLTAPM